MLVQCLRPAQQLYGQIFHFEPTFKRAFDGSSNLAAYKTRSFQSVRLAGSDACYLFSSVVSSLTIELISRGVSSDVQADCELWLPG